MSVHLQRELDRLRHMILEQCAQVERNVSDAARAFLERDVELAKLVVAAERLVDKREIEIEDACLGLLALYQPVAADLRLVFATVKINGSLERIGDLAENLAKKAKSLARRPALAVPPEFGEMTAITREMLTACIDAFVALDSSKAAAVVSRDDEVDRRKRDIRKRAEAAIALDPASAGCWLSVVAASRNVERIADLAAAVAEEVVYTVEGRSLRHMMDDDA